MSVTSFADYVDTDSEDESEDWIDRAVANGMGFKSNEERQRYIDAIGDPLEHPMFATPEDMKNHPLAGAFDLLRDEGKTNLELALINKDEGNMYVKRGDTEHYELGRGKYRLALAFIDKAEKIIADKENALANSIENVSLESDKEGGETEEIQSDDPRAVKETKSLVYLNLGQTELSCKNYRRCIENCNMSLFINQKLLDGSTELDDIVNLSNRNIKAYYRKCKSLMALKLFTKGVEVCNYALLEYERLQEMHKRDNTVVVPSNSEFLKLLNMCKKEHDKMMAEMIRNTNKMISTNKIREDKYRDAWEICQANKIKLSYSTLDHPGQLRTYFPFYDSSPTKTAKFPVLLLYPQYNKFDIIEGVENLDEMIAVYLAEILPEPEEDGGETVIDWDEDNEYHVSNVDVYCHVFPHSKNKDLQGMVINSLDEWVFSCQVYHEISSGNSSFVKPFVPPDMSLPQTPASITSSPPAVPVSGGSDVIDYTKWDSKLLHTLTNYVAPNPSATMTKQAIEDTMLRRRKTFYVEKLSREHKKIANGTRTSADTLLLSIHLGCTFRQIVNTPDLVLSGGLITLVVYPKLVNPVTKKVNRATEKFLKENTKELGYSLKYLSPLGKVVNTNS